MHLETESMTGAVEETDRSLGRMPRFEPVAGEDIEALLVDMATVDPGADDMKGCKLGGADRGDEVVLGLVGASL